MLEIDGSYGEAGGQILRTALSLSSLLKHPFRMFNIRKGRRKPGLRPQHLMCIRALAQISHARVQGESEGSTEIIFDPSDVKSGDYIFDIGTAGSVNLLLQAILPPLIFSKKRSSVVLTGGTHVPFSPSFHYINEVFIPMLYLIGIKIDARIDLYGFYPKGGGKINAYINPSRDIQKLRLLNRGGFKTIRIISGVANLPVGIAERQRNAALKTLARHGLSPESETLSVPAFGSGTFIFIKSETGNCIAGFSSLGERGKKAELVGEEAAIDFLGYQSSSACIDSHLADQIVPYLAFAGGESSFTTSRLTNHLLTNLWVIEKFTGSKYAIEGEPGMPGKVMLTGKSLSLYS